MEGSCALCDSVQVCVQTLYGHSGTVTALVILGDYIVSSSTDGSIKMWRQEEGRGQLVYPWFELQVCPAGGWGAAGMWLCLGERWGTAPHRPILVRRSVR